MNMTIRGLGYTFGAVTLISPAHVERADCPVSVQPALGAWAVGGEPSDHYVGGFLADYSALTEAEWNEADDEHDAILARSVSVSRTAGV